MRGDMIWRDSGRYVSKFYVSRQDAIHIRFHEYIHSTPPEEVKPPIQIYLAALALLAFLASLAPFVASLAASLVLRLGSAFMEAFFSSCFHDHGG